MDNTQKSPTVLSLCSGYGGIEIGLKRVLGKLRVLTYVEIEAFAVANLVAKMEKGLLVPAPIWTDIKTFKAGLFRNQVDILIGGYPCQPFSCAGKRKGGKDPRHLWPYVRETINACAPRWVFFENVEGHITKGCAEILTDLESMAYTPVAGVFSAEEVGAPHGRKRVFILAHAAHNNGWSGVCSMEKGTGANPEWWRGFAGSSKKVANPRGAQWRQEPRTTNGANRNDSRWEETSSGVGKCSQTMANNQGNRWGEGWPKSTGQQGRFGFASSRSELGNTNPRRFKQPFSNITNKFANTGEKLEHPGSSEFNRISEPKEHQQGGAAGNPGQEMGNAPGNNKWWLPITTMYRAGLQAGRSGGYLGDRWPAGQGYYQYAWEQPRLKPRLGRTASRRTCRVDRLRLLGNGVVPATAAKAFITLLRILYQKMMHKKYKI